MMNTYENMGSNSKPKTSKKKVKKQNYLLDESNQNEAANRDNTDED